MVMAMGLMLRFCFEVVCGLYDVCVYALYYFMGGFLCVWCVGEWPVLSVIAAEKQPRGATEAREVTIIEGLRFPSEILSTNNRTEAKQKVRGVS
jgi:hypothetical protein